MQTVTRSSLSVRCSVARPSSERCLRKGAFSNASPVHANGRAARSPKAARVYAPLRSDAEISETAAMPETQLEEIQTEQEALLSKAELLQLENELSRGAGIRALVDFNNALRQLAASNWESKLHPVFREWCFNLESFNPAFAAVLLQVQLSIGESDYDRRDDCLRSLIQPLAGEYGMHNNEPQGKTHRQLFRDFYESLFPQLSMSGLFSPEPVHAKVLFQKMLKDIQSHGDLPVVEFRLNVGITGENSVERASYALGYNLAIEYLADYEKRWMLHSFQLLSSTTIKRDIDWVFLEIHAEDEKEHAEIGHEAVLSFVPRSHVPLLKKAMTDHDRDFAAFYKELTRLLKE